MIKKRVAIFYLLILLAVQLFAKGNSEQSIQQGESMKHDMYDVSAGWPSIMALGMEIAGYAALRKKYAIRKETIDAEELPEYTGFSPIPGRNALRVSFLDADTNELITDYIIIPLQSLFFKKGAMLTGMIDPDYFFTATSHLLIFHPAAGPAWIKYKDEIAAIEDAIAFITDEKQNNTESAETREEPISNSVRIISIKLFRHYSELEVAIPGTSLPSDEELSAIAGRKLVRLFLVPDIGDVKRQWIHVPGNGETAEDRDAAEIINDELSSLASDLRNEKAHERFPAELKKAFDKIRARLKPVFSEESEYNDIVNSVRRLLSLE